MQLLTLNLTNVRQLNGTYRFYPGFNLLVGENGTGKTTLLRAVLTAARQAKGGLKLTASDIRYREGYFEIHATTMHEGVTTEMAYRLNLREAPERSRASRSASVLYYSSTEATCAGLTEKKARRYLVDRTDPVRRNEAFFYGEEMRERRAASSGVKFGESRSIRPFVMRLLSVFSTTISDFSWAFEPYACAIKLRQSDKNLELEPKTRRELSRALMRFVQESAWDKSKFSWPDRTSITVDAEGYWSSDDSKERVRLLPHLEEILSESSFDSKLLTLLRSCTIEFRLTPRIVIRRGDEIIQLSQLSDGEQRLFSLVTDIARNLSLQESGAPIPRRSAVILIDEIDVHLHPKWQRKIVPALEDLFPECQFIATTHSPFVIQAVDRSKILVAGSRRHLAQDGQNNSIEDIIEDIQGVDLPQRSLRAERLSKAAEKYFGLLKNSERARPLALQAAEDEYREASEPYTMEPAAHALLKLAKLERKTK